MDMSMGNNNQKQTTTYDQNRPKYDIMTNNRRTSYVKSNHVYCIDASKACRYNQRLFRNERYKKFQNYTYANKTRSQCFRTIRKTI